MKLKNVQGWLKTRAANTDSYGKCALDFAEQWADLMEERMAEGAVLKDIYDATSHEVDHRPGFGITGFMFGAAVSILSQVWEHGDELRIAHNAEYGVGPEAEGTVNPAVFSIAPK
jgi:hypothetical protein